MAKTTKTTKTSKKQPTVLNWMGSLLLYSIPGVNLIFLILSAIFAKSSSKRSFAIAGILLLVVFAVLIFLAFALFPDFFTRLTEAMRQAAHPNPIGE
ncbi:MAG: hypothetical protein IJV64_11865, partial [Oscillospiraceae bacterium]|nr:hypothetical protein [Oscillospiraceae bacterium]